MKRREFLEKSAAVTLPAIIGGYSVKAYNANSPLVQALLSGGGTDTDHVLVIIQLSGGNDGLNMVIPISTYSLYNSARTNIAIPEAKILRLNGYDKTGLHPSMTGLQGMYNENKLKVIQAVGYPTPNFSHFRATDIWMTASNSTQEVYTGWAGRYLNYEYPNFPTGYPNSNVPDPLAIQIGSIAALTTQGPTVNMAMSITSATNFYQLINGTSDPVPATKAGKELSYIRTVAKQTQQYAGAITTAAGKVTAQVTYPGNNSLADQLKIVARLIKGGLKTRIYMVSFGGFDNHSLQTTTTDTTAGTHATLLGRVSDAIKAFQDDLIFLGIEDRVVGMTFSEFGRRIKSNSSVGTDHGAAAPLFVFGKPVEGGVLGDNPAIPASATVNDNVPMQYDFRSIYSTLLQNWFCLDKTTVQSLFPAGINTQLQDLPLIKSGVCNGSTPPPSPSGKGIITNYPNPFTGKTTIEFSTDGGHTLIQIIDTAGRLLLDLLEKDYPAATRQTITFDASHLPNGIYYARLQNGAVQQVRPMLKVR
jgi:uncharacterized protein (DUF1501 family)